MAIDFTFRESDCPEVERVWQSRSGDAGWFHSMANSNWGAVVTRVRGRAFLTFRGPETRATMAECPAEGEWIGILFRVGTFMPSIPPRSIANRRDLHMPDSPRTFSLGGSWWEYPGYENAEEFVRRLVQRGLLVTDPVVRAALSARARCAPTRNEQRRFLRATGTTFATIRQIARAREAASLLRSGTTIADVTYGLGYFDQSHLTRSLKHFVGQTPAQLSRADAQLSLLYKP